MTGRASFLPPERKKRAGHPWPGSASLLRMDIGARYLGILKAQLDSVFTSQTVEFNAAAAAMARALASGKWLYLAGTGH